MNNDSKDLAFRANVGIKDIVGRGLILDDNIAIIELIKNSKDASSPYVKLQFISATSSSSEGLVLKDFGVGMNLSDIRDKWLNIAYSEKKIANRGRDKPFAGSKGVGRFSCDRLGKKLVLYTKSEFGDYLKLPVDWSLFEKDSISAEISTVKLKYEILSREEFLDEIDEKEFKTGTVLKISKLRSSWNGRKLNGLKSELEKFISNPDSRFEVFFKMYDMPEEKISNTVFDELSLRTYNIISSIDAAGENLITELLYHGERVYKYEVANPYLRLRNIKINVHYMNFSSKIFFKKKTGYAANDYGSVFLFLNGFRVSPYGNPKNDWLGLDQRKTQGTARYLGTRDVIGQISVLDSEDIFKPVTSREGLVHDEAFRELTEDNPKNKIVLKNGEPDYGFAPHIIRQLERFIVEGVNWSTLMDLSNPKRKNIKDKDLISNPLGYAIRSIDEASVKDAINKTLRTSSFGIESFEVNEDLISRLAKEAEDEYNEYILSFIKNTTDKTFDQLTSVEKGNFKKIALRNMEAIKAEKQARIEAQEQRLRADQAELKAKFEKERADKAKLEEKAAREREAVVAVERDKAIETAKLEKIEREEAEARLEESTHENMFLKMDASKDHDHVLNLHHQTALYSSIAGTEVENLKHLLLESEGFDREQALNSLASIKESIEKISKFANFATGGKYKIALTSISGDFIRFVSDYLEEIKSSPSSLRRMKIINELDGVFGYKTEFSPLDVMILVDNLISNAKRHRAKKVAFLSPVSEDGLLCVVDNGVGLNKSISDAQKIFEKGFTTRVEGSGRGLFHVQQTLKKMNLKIQVADLTSSGWSGLAMEIKKC